MARCLPTRVNFHLFGLEPYFDGVLLRIPSTQDPSKLGELIRQRQDVRGVQRAS